MTEARTTHDLAPLRRLILQSLGWGALFAASPGVLAPDGLWLLAIVGVALWGESASRAGRFAIWIEWFAAACGWAATCSWAAYVWPGSIAIIGVGLGVFFIAASAILRRIARVAPLAFAVPAAWVGIDTLRMLLEPPYGFGWMRLGVHLHAAEWIVGSARFFGIGGLSWVLASLAGFSIDVVRAFARHGERPLRELRLPALIASIPLFTALFANLLTSPPPTVDGPRVMLVQPGIPQERKMKQKTSGEMFLELEQFTERGLSEARSAHEPEPDLVTWGETMIGICVVDRKLAAAVDRGLTADPWWGFEVDREWVDGWLDEEDAFVGRGLFGKSRKSGALAPGTNFLSGAEYFTVADERIRRENAVLLWNANGERGEPAVKQHLVPSAETMVGLERYEFIRNGILGIAGYVPDFLKGDRTGVFELATRSGASYRMSATVCFDNAFDGPYTSALREGPVDFHVVVSNEAWYRKSFEVDQMMAFSHLIAVMTGRTMVRCTNSGISSMIGPDGRELARLSVGGEDREVSGTLRVTVPVPERDGQSNSARTPFVRLEGWWNALWLALPIFGLGLAFARRNRRIETGREAR